MKIREYPWKYHMSTRTKKFKWNKTSLFILHTGIHHAIYFNGIVPRSLFGQKRTDDRIWYIGHHQRHCFPKINWTLFFWSPWLTGQLNWYFDPWFAMFYSICFAVNQMAGVIGLDVEWPQRSRALTSFSRGVRWRVSVSVQSPCEWQWMLLTQWPLWPLIWSPLTCLLLVICSKLIEN